jgi:Protein of unknown function (DUF2934)
MDLQKCPLTDEEKHRMIAEAAFFKSQKRATPGDPMADWLGAERELEDALTAFCRSANQEPELSAKRQIRAEVRRILEKAGDTVNGETIRQALAKVTAELHRMGTFLPETIDRASTSVKQEIAGTIEKLGHNWTHFRIKPSELVANWKERGTQTLNQTSRSFYSWLSHWRNRDDH